MSSEAPEEQEIDESGRNLTQRRIDEGPGDDRPVAPEPDEPAEEADP